MATDLKNVLREEAAQCRLLADMATEPTIKQALLAMATRLQAAADSDTTSSRLPRDER